MSLTGRDTPRPFQPPVAQRDIKAEVAHCVGGVITAIWGEISASAEQRGRPRPQNDTWVGCLDARAARSAPISQELALNFLAQHVLGLPSHR
jgi:hypothetical protein